MKRVSIKCILTLTMITCLICCIYAQDSSGEEENNEYDFLSFEASYVGDNINIIAGGIKSGSCYLGMGNMKMRFNTEKAGLWKGGEFFVNAANTHGDQPSKDFIGDVQVVSNIEAGNHTYLQEVWYKQIVGKTEITAGLQDLNVEFASSEYGALYSNSSFGILPIISNNLDASIFPLTTTGLTLKSDISNETKWVNAIYDGRPTNFDYDPYNLKWQFNSNDGVLLISEVQKNKEINHLPGVYKLGAYLHFHFKKNTPDSLIKRLFGIYAYVDQTVWSRNKKNAGLFVQLGYTPSKESTNNFYFGSGLNFTGLFSKKAKDTLGLAVAHVNFTHSKKNETTIELTYLNQLIEYFFIQPDFQYIIHPSGTDQHLKNALTANFRFGFNF